MVSGRASESASQGRYAGRTPFLWPLETLEMGLDDTKKRKEPLCLVYRHNQHHSIPRRFSVGR